MQPDFQTASSFRCRPSCACWQPQQSSSLCLLATEGAGTPAGAAIRDPINQGLIPGPRMRISGNAVDITGGHEDAIGHNPAVHLPSNADYADSDDDLVRVIRRQRKEGADIATLSHVAFVMKGGTVYRHP